MDGSCVTVGTRDSISLVVPVAEVHDGAQEAKFGGICRCRGTAERPDSPDSAEWIVTLVSLNSNQIPMWEEDSEKSGYEPNDPSLGPPPRSILLVSACQVVITPAQFPSADELKPPTRDSGWSRHKWTRFRDGDTERRIGRDHGFSTPRGKSWRELSGTCPDGEVRSYSPRNTLGLFGPLGSWGALGRITPLPLPTFFRFLPALSLSHAEAAVRGRDAHRSLSSLLTLPFTLEPELRQRGIDGTLSPSNPACL
ncbi:hypothetical protein BDW69DRAFT_27725 [Aspergillus filifer]